MEHPEQLAAPRANPILLRCTQSGLPTVALAEILRWTTTVNYLARTATRDTALAGVNIKADDRVVMWYASGSRDSDIMPGDDRFDIGRPVQSITHYAFGGGGPHRCQGGFLATKMLSVAMPQIIGRLPDIRLAGKPERASTVFANQLVSLPVEFTAA